MKKARCSLFSCPVLLVFIPVFTFFTTSLWALPDGLQLGTDNRGEYASYILEKGDTVWGAVVMKYVMPSKRSSKTAGEILKRSGIKDATKIREGAEIKIPLEYLSPDIKPKKLKKAKPLHGVVVILDPGHGGIDTGARGRGNMYEDEVVYDIACRLKQKLEGKTSAQVFMTLRDRSRGYAPNHSEHFPFDQDEYIQTTPIYYMKNTKIGVHLRWYLANSIYRRKLREGITSSNVVFISIHADALGRKARGTMIYYPGSNYCKNGWRNPGPTLRRFREVKECPNVSFGYSERVRSEKRSKIFAETIINSLHRNRIKVFSNKPIRDHIIRQSEFAPAVLKYNAVPTKILIETVNLQNRTDISHIRNAWFRESYAQALLEALLDFYQ